MGVVTSLINFILSAQGAGIFLLAFVGAMVLSACHIASPRAPLWSFAASVMVYVVAYAMRTFGGVGGGI